MARLRLEIAQEIGRLNLTERARQRLINSIRAVQKEVRDAEREIDSFTEKLSQKADQARRSERVQAPHFGGQEAAAADRDRSQHQSG